LIDGDFHSHSFGESGLEWLYSTWETDFGKV